MAPGWIGVCAALVLVACHAPDVVHLPGGQRLKVEGSEQQGVRWQVSRGGPFRVLPTPPVSFMPVQVVPSPDGRYLAVVSAGEGHPVLDLLSLPKVMEGTHGDRALLSLDPYPGSLSILGWSGPRLVLESDRPLDTRRDVQGRPEGTDVFDGPRRFELDPETGQIVAVGAQ